MLTFKEWLKLQEYTPGSTRDYRKIWGPTGYFDKPVGFGDVVPIGRGLSGIATGIGDAMRRTLYPKGTGSPELPSQVIDLDNIEDQGNRLEVTATAPIVGNEKKTADKLKQQILDELKDTFKEKRIDPRFGKVHDRYSNGKELTLVMHYPKSFFDRFKAAAEDN